MIEWKARQTRGNNRYEYTLRTKDVVDYNGGDIIAEIEFTNHASAKDNARLIAAAPDLLEALRPFAGFACDDWETHGCFNCIAKQAIAKAEGA